MNYICFDLEGPLSPQDNAYELMSLFPRGGQVFEVISRYDDLLALEGREDYEPGDTLALIIPFLVCHGISESDITGLAEKASLVEGARELITGLKGWKVFCISTSYEQYARRIVQRAGIPFSNLACTHFPLERYARLAKKDDLARVEDMEREILAMSPEDDEGIKSRLDRFFWTELPGTSLGPALEEVKAMGGQRKVAALRGFASDNNSTLRDWLAVGDSITDYKMLQEVHQAGGLAIAFNANEYALPYATMGLASTNLGDLGIVMDAWEKGGKAAVEALIREKERAGGKGDRGNFHWLSGREDTEKVPSIHKRIRGIVRRQAAKLG